MSPGETPLSTLKKRDNYAVIFFNSHYNTDERSRGAINKLPEKRRSPEETEIFLKTKSCLSLHLFQQTPRQLSGPKRVFALLFYPQPELWKGCFLACGFKLVEFSPIFVSPVGNSRIGHSTTLQNCEQSSSLIPRPTDSWVWHGTSPNASRILLRTQFPLTKDDMVTMKRASARHLSVRWSLVPQPPWSVHNVAPPWTRSLNQEHKTSAFLKIIF